MNSCAVACKDESFSEDNYIIIKLTEHGDWKRVYHYLSQQCKTADTTAA